MTDTNDKELIRLAAKSAGINALIDPHGVWRNCTDSHPARNIFAAPTWNPLTDVGDALRLAVHLNLFTSAAFYKFRSLERFSGQDAEDITAICRAIVRAAAEIGRAMPHD